MPVTEISHVLALGFLVIIFGSVLRRRPTGQLFFWFYGWLLVLAHFATGAIPQSQLSPVMKALDAGTIELAGVFFIVAVSTVCREARERWRLAASISMPALVYSTAVSFELHSRVIYFALLVVGIVGTTALIWSYYRRLTTYVFVITSAVLALGVAIGAGMWMGAYARVIALIQGGIFFICGGLYARRFARLSAGVVTACLGFCAWGIALANDGWLRLPPIAASILSPHIPTYLVAFAMILTLLEEQIQEAVTAGEKVAHQASHDVLTGLPNRMLFEDRLTQAMLRAQRAHTRAAVMCIDLDRFKQVNDLFGHHVGDLYLKGVVARLTTRLRKSDTLARTGGDEFSAVIADLASPEAATVVARSMLETFESPLDIQGCRLQAAASIGIAMYPDDGETPDALRRAADQAMYWAKANGRNQYELFSSDARDALEIEDRLKHALDRNEFHLVYQPQYGTDGSIAGVEALLRLTHPRLGIIPPSRFIPLAEKNGHIVAIGEWVLRRACRQILEWEETYGIRLRVAVNVSALQFGRADFADMVAATLNDTGADPSLIELELTESVVVGNVEDAARQIANLKRLGVSVSVDDFGTGYSSLSYLHQLPIDTLKIDRSFVEKIANSVGTRPIVEAVVSLAKTLRMRTIAEGVETQDQLAAVRQVGCDFVQGFLLSHPVAADKIPDLIAEFAHSTQ